MKCPKCEAESLRSHRIGEIDVDQCEACGGVWFDLGELDDTLEDGGRGDLKYVEATLPGDDMKPAPCPRCGGTGNMVPVKNVEHGFHIDTCTVCQGKWLDGGELEILEEKNLLERIHDLLRFE